MRAAREHNAHIVGAWLSAETDTTPLEAVGFERGWEPWWMAARLLASPHPVGMMSVTALGSTLPAMIERLADMPPGTIGFRVAGEIERDDYDKVLVPELQRGLDAGDGLRTLYVVDHLNEIDPGAMWADAKVGFNLGIRHREAWVRSAIVTDIEWIARSTKLFAWMIPGEARVFPAAELEQAKTWVAGG
jgi:SpoIIAA-like